MPQIEKTSSGLKGMLGREVIQTTLPLSEDTRRHSPDKFVLQFSEPVLTVDVGRLCFRRREFSARRRGQTAGLVDPKTLSDDRIQLVRRLIEAAETLLAKGSRPLSVLQKVMSFSRLVDWADKTSKGDLITHGRVRKAIESYFEYLNASVVGETLTTDTVAGYQRNLLDICKKIFPGPDLFIDLELQKGRTTNAGTVPPSELVQGRQLLLDQTLFTSLSAVALDFPAFPVYVEVPEYLNEPENTLWLFPVSPYFSTQAERAKQVGRKRLQRVMDFSNGRVREESEILEEFDHPYKAQTAVFNANRRLELSNSNRRHHSRLKLGLIAARAFLDMFCATTGMNWSDAVRLPWSGEYTVGVVRQNFRTIKHRAGGKEIEYDIEAIFLPKFKRYLELRAYLLDNVEWPYLFFQGEVISCGKIEPRLYGHNSSTLHRFQTRLDPTLDPIGNKGWRAAVTNHSVDTYGPEVTATRFQKSMHVVRRHYASGTPTQTIREIGDYFEQLESVTLRNSRRGCPESAAGDCAKHGFPNSVIEKPAVIPDCNEPAGCLFCDKYFLVPDERDVRKLFSFRFVVNMTKSLSKDVSHWSSIHGPIIKRIDQNIAAISNRSDAHTALVERVKHEVEVLGKLDEYWLSKLQMLNFLMDGALW